MLRFVPVLRLGGNVSDWLRVLDLQDLKCLLA
jgi:hypothetical protein